MNYKHGASNEPWYSNYSSMVQRVTNPNSNDYKYYNSKHIHGKMIEQSWLDNPWEFYKEIGPKPGKHYSIDRIDSSKGYIKGNVRWADRETQVVNRRVTIDGKLTKLPVGIKLEPKGVNRRIRDKYLADITVNGVHFRLGSYYIFDNALRRRYDAETKFGFKHTFKRPKGDYEVEPNFGSDNPGVVYDKNRNKWQVEVYIGNRKMKYVGRYDSKAEAIMKYHQALQQYHDNPDKFVNTYQRHRKGIIAIKPDGTKEFFKGISDFKKKYHTNANISRRLKSGTPFTRKRSKFYGWSFKYAE